MMRLATLFLFAFAKAEDFYSFSAKTITGSDFDFEQLRNSMSLVVNVASECGYTDSHYKDLPRLQAALDKYPFQILAFPCNQFGAQEPGDNFDIMTKMTHQYYINFKLFEKVDVIGTDAHPAFQWLTQQSKEPTWNFWKWLIGPDGEPLKAWGPEHSVEDIAEEILELVQPLGERGEEVEPDPNNTHPNDEL